MGNYSENEINSPYRTVDTFGGSDLLDISPGEPEMVWDNVDVGGVDMASPFLVNMSAIYGGSENDQTGNGIGGAPYDDPIDTRNFVYPVEVKVTPVWEIGIKVAFYVVVISVALLGNLAVVITVWKKKRLHTTTNYYIVNLAVSDLMVTLSCTWVHLVDDLTEGWVLGAFFCKINSFCQVLSLVSSILTLTLISCDRFFGIVFAMRAHLTERRAHTFILIVWIISIGISTPLLFYRQQEARYWMDHVEVWCADNWPSVTDVIPPYNATVLFFPSRALYYTLISLVLYFVPILIMSIAYLMIIYKLWSRLPPGESIDCETSAQVRVKRRVVIMLMTILSVFAVCWLPFQISILYAEHREDSHLPMPDWYYQFQYFAIFLAYANSAFNPVIYTCFNENFRKAFKEVFCFRQRRAQYVNGCRSSACYYNTVEMRSSDILKTTEIARL